MKVRFIFEILFVAIVIITISCSNPKSQITGSWQIEGIDVDTTNNKASLAIAALALADAVPSKITIGDKTISLDYGSKASEEFKYRVTNDSLFLQQEATSMPFQYHIDKEGRLILSSLDIKLYLKK